MQRGSCNESGCRCCIFDAKDDDPKLCECGHKRNFHLAPRTEQTRLSLSGAKSVSDMVASVFENEVNAHLNSHLPSCLPGCRISDFRKRQIEFLAAGGEDLLEIDSFAYFFEDNCLFGCEMPTNGIFLIAPRNCEQQKSVPAEKKPSNPPGATGLMKETEAEKYIIGESYSGQSEDRVRAKVETLELRVQKMQTRHCEKHSIEKPVDVTCAVGAVLLSFSSGPRQRKEAKTRFDNFICESMSAKSTPLLWRMAQARRFFLVVLSNTENPTSTSFRETASQMHSVQLQIDEVHLQIDEMSKEMKDGFALQSQNIASQSQNIALQSQNIDSLKAMLESPMAKMKTKGHPPRNSRKSKAETPCKFGGECKNLKNGNCPFFHHS